MKRWGSLLPAVALIFAAAFFTALADQAGSHADAVGFGVTMYLETPLQERDAEALFERESLQEDAAAFTVWGELADQRILDPDLARSIKADVVILCGESERLLPQAPVLFSDDTKGCLIGEETAWELFGSTKVIGDEIRIGNEIRLIRGVMDWPKEGVVITGSLQGITEGTGDEKCSFYDRITLSSKKTADGEAFLARNGLAGRALRFDDLRGLSWLSELIPGRWSDFSGWKENYRNKRQDFELVMQVHKNSLEIYYVEQCMALILNRALAFFCVWAATAYLFKACDRNHGQGLFKCCKKPCM